MHLAFKTLFIIALGLSSVSAKEIKVCAEDSQWFPMVFKSENGEIRGVQVDIVKKSLDSLNLKYDLKLLPWKRCLRNVEEGSYDAAIGASYTKTRALFMNYPISAKESAENSTKHQQRIAQSEYVVVTHNGSNFKFDGNLNVVPQPIYVPAGFSIAEDLRRVGLEVDDGAKKDISNFQKLLRSKKGSVVAIRELALSYKQTLKTGNELIISSRSIKSKSNYLGFSKKTKLSEETIQKIWKQITKTREESIKALYKKYSLN
jgi:ABC-type amino acid transport substrate-binding protein